MSELNVIIHIGLSKCASTYLQKIIFPQIGNYSNVGFAPVGEKYYLFRSDMKPEKYRKIITLHMMNPKPDSNWLVISCEDYTEFLFKGFEDIFFKWEPIERDNYYFSNAVIAENIARIYPMARIIVVIREQLSWAISRYKMYYRGGKTSSTIDELITEPLEGYDAMVERYQTWFGRENVLVLPLEMMHRDRVDFVKRITNFINPDVVVDAPDIQVNVAPELKRAVEYERLKNYWRLHIRRSRWLTPPGQFLARIFARLLVGCLKPFFFFRYGAYKYSVSPTAESMERLRLFLARTNRRLEKLTGLDLVQYGYLVDR